MSNTKKPQTSIVITLNRVDAILLNFLLLTLAWLGAKSLGH
jgi:hypothetical protein